MTRSPAAARRPTPPNPARELGVRVLMRVMSGDAFASSALDAALHAARLPARDAGLATHLVYGTLRHHASLRAALEPLLSADTHPKVWTLLLVGTFEKLHLGTPAHAVVSEYVNLARDARLAPPGLVNAVLRRVEPVPTSPAAELPEWLADTFRGAYGPQANAVMASLLEPQPLWLSLSDAGAASLVAEGSTVTSGPQGIDRVELARPLRETAAYTDGQAQPINPASMACVAALGGVQGARVLDLAGGAGIKAAMLAAHGADVTSVDLQPGRHAAARRNLRRLGLEVTLLTHDLTQPLEVESAPLVLLDAPCTGTGTLRSHPEIKLRLSPDGVRVAAELQARLLTTAAPLVAPGGVLVYSVCSVTREEGRDVVDAFLATHPAFRAEPVPGVDAPHVPAGPGILTVPTDGLDGFFIARLRRADA